jgi:TonB family protein
VRRRQMIRRVLAAYLVILAPVFPLSAQPANPAGAARLPKAVYTPRPEYRPEWAKQGLVGKGVVLVNIDTKTGKVTGVQMEQSTGNKLLDGSALQAYSQWRFEPGGPPQVKMPIEFSNRQPPQASNQRQSQSATPYLILIIIALAGIVIALLKRRRQAG